VVDEYLLMILICVIGHGISWEVRDAEEVRDEVLRVFLSRRKEGEIDPPMKWDGGGWLGIEWNGMARKKSSSGADIPPPSFKT
jgi:hypothetical protein